MNRETPIPVLAPLLREKRDAIVRRWTAVGLATYPAEAAAVFGREQDRFANPIGDSVRRGTDGVVVALCDGMDAAAIRAALREIVQIRAVQQLSPSQALGFVFRLKELVRDELGGAADDPRVAAELPLLDAAIDRVALAAFDVFTDCRERVYQLRVEEAKRRVAWVVDRLNRRGGEALEP